jgi:catechol 2,3-dioxygenase-like lactoylglutathione lyase family enzyme
MHAHVSSILLGVEDMDRSKRFYTEGLGWEVEQGLRRLGVLRLARRFACRLLRP